MAYCSVHYSKRRNLIILLLLVMIQSLLADKNTGSKKKSGSASGNGITFNPNNPFLKKSPLTDTNYQGNLFLNPPASRFQVPQTGNNNGITKPLTSGKDNGLINSFLSGNSNRENKKMETVNYSHNPFLILSLEIANKSNNAVFPGRQNHKNEEKASPVTNTKGNSTESSINSSGDNIDKPILPNTEKKREKEKPLHAPQKQQNPPSLVLFTTEDFPTRENSRTKSDLKCEEYSRQILKTTETISLVGTNTQVIKVANDKCTTPDRLVTGGTVATPGEFPHMVALGSIVNRAFVYECAGTLISPLWVLTAAHCTHSPDGGPSVVKVGFHNLKDNQSEISIERTIRHPSYKFPAMYADIALIKLQRTVTFNDFVKPACLYQLYDNVPMKAWVSGWGATELAGEQSEKLQKAQLDIIDNIACSIRHNNSISVPYGVTPSMICAGDPEGGWKKDTCQGDSGGPLQVPHPKHLCLFQVIGITSFGDGCAIVNTPGVYTRVSHYLNWIEDIVWPDE